MHASNLSRSGDLLSKSTRLNSSFRSSLQLLMSPQKAEAAATAKKGGLLGKLRSRVTQPSTAEKKKEGGGRLMVAIPRRNAFDTSRWRDSTNLLDSSRFYERLGENGSFRDSLS